MVPILLWVDFDELIRKKNVVDVCCFIVETGIAKVISDDFVCLDTRFSMALVLYEQLFMTMPLRKCAFEFALCKVT